MTTRDTPFDMIIPLESVFVDSNTTIVNKVTIDNSTTININLNKIEFKNLFKCQSVSGNDIINNHNLLIDNFKSFFNEKSNYKLFANDLYTILMNKYDNIYINLRKLNNLCKSEGAIWNSIFLSPTIFNHTDTTLDRKSIVHEEIAIDFKNMIEQDDNPDIDSFWDNLVAQDNVTLTLSLDMSAFSETNASISIFVKFNVLNSSNQYNFNLDSTS